MAEATLEAEEAGPVPPAAPEPPATAGPPPEAAPPPAAGTGGGPVLVRDRYLIDTNKPLPDLDSPSAKAYAVEDRRDLGRKLFGLICTPGLPVRTGAIKAVKDADFPGILPLVDYDVAYWPPLGESTMVIIYQFPRGGRVIDRLAKKEIRITEYDLPRRIIDPLIQGLQIINDQGEPHRAIRPNNIYFLDEEMTDVVLGDFVTSPPGFDQPIIFEPLERAMASPGGRGLGVVRDDIYALGATVVPLILGHNPVARMKEVDIIRSRLEIGSYSTLCGTSRVPLPLLDPLRGLLHDDPKLRWDLSQVLKWLDAQPLDSLPKTSDPKATTAFTFKGGDHHRRRTLAYDFSRYPADAAKAIKSEEFMNWVRRDLNDTTLADAIQGIIENAAFHKDDYQGSDDYVVNRVSIRMDPNAPIRYKGLAFMPDGFGPLLAVELLRKGDAKVPVEIMSRDIAAPWFSAQSTPFPGASELQRFFAQIKGFMSIKDPGYGVERVLYESNPSLPCQSPLVAHEYVVSVRQLLPALDRTANNTDMSKRPIDRHVAAFIAARFNEDIHPHLKALASPKDETSIIGVLSLLAFLQWKMRTPAVLGLSSWVGGLLGPAINSYHNRNTRREIENAIPRLVRQGSLPELFNLVDNAEKRHADIAGYEAAKAEWIAAQAEIQDIEGAGDERLTKAERSGQQAAAVISITMSMIFIMTLIILQTL